MTVTRYACPDAAYLSSRYEATANGVSVDVFSWERDTEFAVPFFWSQGADVEVSMVTVDADEPVEFVVKLTDAALVAEGSLEGLAFFPLDALRSYSWDDDTSEFRFTLHPGKHLRVELNNNVHAEGAYGRARCLFVRVLEPLAIPGGATVFDQATTTEVPEGETYTFPSGQVIDLYAGGGAHEGLLFPVRAGGTIYIPGDTIVIGNIDVRAPNVTVDGRGYLSGEFLRNEELPGNFAEDFPHALIFGHTSGVFYTGRSISGITLVMGPHFGVADAASYHDNVMVIGPWTDNSNGFGPLGDGGNDYAYHIRDCITWVGDDAVTAEQWRGNGVIERCHFSTSGASSFNLGYHAETWNTTTFTLTCRDIVVRACTDYYLIGEQTGGAVIFCGTDGTRHQDVNANWSFDGLSVESDEAGINCIVFWLGSVPYTWGDARGNKGQATNVAFRNVRCTHVPAEKSRIVGVDDRSTANGILFENVTMAGVRWSTRNAADYMTVSGSVYNITVDGVSLVA